MKNGIIYHSLRYDHLVEDTFFLKENEILVNSRLFMVLSYCVNWLDFFNIS